MSALQREAELRLAEPTVDAETAAAASCTPQQEAFARGLAESGNASAAYRVAYAPPLSMPRSQVAVYACRTRALPQVQARLEQIQAELALRSITTREQVIAWLAKQVMTDVNDLVFVRRYACRHCHGADYGYQWADEAEFTASYVATLDANALMPQGKRKLPLPTDAGGYGWSKQLDPNQLCPHCLGDGTAEAIIRDTTKLEGGALALYAGVKETAAGTVLVMNDKGKLLDTLCSMMGWKKDALPGGGLQPPGSQAHAALPTGITEADAAKHYLRLVGGVN